MGIYHYSPPKVSRCPQDEQLVTAEIESYWRFNRLKKHGDQAN